MRTSVMKRLLLSIAVASAFAALAATGAQAAVVSRGSFPSDFTFFDACSGEDVHVTGTVQVLATSTVNGDHISGALHTVFLATGTGLVSGLTYHEEVAYNSEMSSSLLNGRFTVTTFGEINVVAPGGGNNLWSPILFHSTFDASGNLVSTTVNPFPQPGCH